MNIAYFWLTEQGKTIAERIRDSLGGQLEPEQALNQNLKSQNLKSRITQAFRTQDALVFVMATGIVVRMLADLLESKTTDPAVIVLDQQGKFVISLLSGHLGGANELAQEIAGILHAVPVITTATDTEGLVAIDVFAKKNHLKIENPERIKFISRAMLRGEKITIYADPGIDLQEDETILRTDQLPADVIISDWIQNNLNFKQAPGLLLRPPSLVVGIGCKKNIKFQDLEDHFLEFLTTQGLSLLSVCKIATISLKSQEPAILELCRKYHLELQIIPDEEIRKLTDSENPGNSEISENPVNFERSAFVEKITGLPSVAEACSYLGADRGERLTGKVKFPGITLSICRKKSEKLYFK